MWGAGGRSWRWAWCCPRSALNPRDGLVVASRPLHGLRGFLGAPVLLHISFAGILINERLSHGRHLGFL